MTGSRIEVNPTGRPRRRLAGLALAASLALTTAACSGADDGADSPTPTSAAPTTAAATTAAVPLDAMAFPGEAWAEAPAEDLGVDQAVLDDIAADAEAAGSDCLLVTRRGRVVGEWYWHDMVEDEPREVFSVTKSLTSTLVGLAQADGDLSIDQPAADFVPEWAGTPSAGVTIENLLSNDSGRHWDLVTDYRDLVGSQDQGAFARSLGQDAPPGTVWAYNNSAIQTLAPILEEATGVPPQEFARTRVFAPIGMENTEVGLDPSGQALAFMGLRTTCQDLARFGHLMLNEGRWGTDQVLPEAWVAAATGRSSQELNAAYGYLWWLNRTGPTAGSTQAVGGDDGEAAADGQLVPGAPEDLFWALGLGNQIVQVDPGSETVVVRIAPGNPGPDAGPFASADTARVVTEAITDDPAGS